MYYSTVISACSSLQCNLNLGALLCLKYFCVTKEPRYIFMVMHLVSINYTYYCKGLNIVFRESKCFPKILLIFILTDDQITNYLFSFENFMYTYVI